MPSNGTVDATSIEKGIQFFREDYPDFFKQMTTNSPIMSKVGINRGFTGGSRIKRRSQMVQGAVVELDKNNDQDFATLIDNEEFMEINKKFNRPFIYDPDVQAIWGDGINPPTQWTKQVVAESIDYMSHDVLVELFGNSMQVEVASVTPDANGVYTLNNSNLLAAGSNENVSDFLIDACDFANQDAGKGSGMGVEILAPSPVKNYFINATKYTQNISSARTQDGEVGDGRNVYGGVSIDTWDAPIRFDLTITTQPTAGDVWVLSPLLGGHAIEWVANNTTFTSTDYNKVSVGANAAGATTNLRGYLNNQTSKGGTGYSRKSNTGRFNSRVRGTHQNLRPKQARWSAEAVTGSTTKLTVTVHGANQLYQTAQRVILGNETSGTARTVAANEITIDNIRYGIAFVCDPCVEYAVASMMKVVDVPSQVSPNHLLVNKANISRQYGVKQFSDDKFKSKIAWVKLTA